MPDHYQHCLDILREGDLERFLTVLYAPQEKRPALAALFAFDVEVRRIRNLVSEPLPGEIRLQWWRDVISGERSGEGRQHPVGAALLDVIDEFALPRAAFDNCLDARIFDLYNDPMPDRGSFEGYLGETVSMFFLLAAQILNEGEDTNCAELAGHAGMACGIANTLCDLPLDTARRQVYMPRDMLGAAGTDPDALIEGSDRDGRKRAVSMLAAVGHDHLATAQAALANAPAKLRIAFLPLATAGARLRLAERQGGETGGRPAGLSPLRTHWLFLRRALLG